MLGASSGKAFYDMPVAVAGTEIHRPVNFCRVFIENLLDMTHRLDKLAPVRGGQEAQTADAVANRHLIRCLLLRIELHLAFDAGACLTQRLLHPVQRQGQRRALALQAAGEFGDKGGGHRRCGAGHVGNGQHHAFDVSFRGFDQVFGPVIGQIALVGVGHDPGGHSPQVFDQRQTQHDRYRPQFAQRKRHHCLIGKNEAAQAFLIDSTVAMGDGLQRDVIDARQPRRRAVDQAWQLTAIAFGQVRSGGANVFLDQIVIVQQPFRCRRHSSAGHLRVGQRRAAAFEQLLVVIEPVQHRVPCGQRGQAMLPGQGDAVTGHLIGAEKLRAQYGLVFESGWRKQTGSPKTGRARKYLL